MMRTLCLVVVSLMCVGQILVAAELECPVEIQTGTAHVILTSYYAHMVGEVSYSDIENQWVTDGPGLVFASSEGHPIGHLWLADNEVIGECGFTPNRLFVDGFESGDFSGWD